jgi:hypothetical protein
MTGAGLFACKTCQDNHPGLYRHLLNELVEIRPVVALAPESSSSRPNVDSRAPVHHRGSCVSALLVVGPGTAC